METSNKDPAQTLSLWRQQKASGSVRKTRRASGGGDVERCTRIGTSVPKRAIESTSGPEDRDRDVSQETHRPRDAGNARHAWRKSRRSGPPVDGREGEEKRSIPGAPAPERGPDRSRAPRTQVMWTTCGTARRNGFGRSGENGDDESHRGRPRSTRDDGRRAEVDKASFSTKGTHDPATDRTGSRERRETRAREPTWPAREAAARFPYGHRKERQRSEAKAQGSCRLAGRSRRRWR